MTPSITARPVAKPIIAVSACLLGQEVRYDGSHKRENYIVDTLSQGATLLPLCPEMEMGMGVPRPTIELRDGITAEGHFVLRRSSDNADLTKQMIQFCKQRIAELIESGVCAFILKSKSPSCGIDNVKVFDEEGANPQRHGVGFFAQALMGVDSEIPIIDEEGLRDVRRREEFLRRVLGDLS